MNTVWLALISILAGLFIAKYAFRYYLPGSQAQIGLSWSRRVVLLAHISGGIVALLAGSPRPWLHRSGVQIVVGHKCPIAGEKTGGAAARGSLMVSESLVLLEANTVPPPNTASTM